MNLDELLKRVEYLCDLRNEKRQTVYLNCGVGKDFGTSLRNGSKPSVEKIIKIADYLNCSTDYLLGRAETPEISNSAQATKEQQLIKAYKQHPELQPAIDKLLGVEELDNGNKLIFRAARSADNHPAEITVLTKEEQERIEKAPRVTSENSDL